MAFADIFNLEITENNKDRYVTRMLVTEDMLQPHGVLHGGISAALAENAASELCTDNYATDEIFYLGVEVSSKHLLPVLPGDTVKTVATPLSVGGRLIHLNVEQYRESDGKLFNVSQMTMYGKKNRK